MGARSAVFLDLASIRPVDLDLSPLHEVVENWQWFDNTAPDAILQAVGDASIVVVNKVVLDATVFESCPALELVCSAATGVNNIDVSAARDSGVTVSNARAYATPSVVQHVFATLLTLVTSLDRYREDVLSSHWSESEFFCLLDHPIRELEGMKLGIVGYGELGRSVADVARAFGMDVSIAKRDSDDDREGRVDLDEMLPAVDVLSLHTPLTESTRGLIGADELAAMRSDAVLINTARGGLVDEGALRQALLDGDIGGAALDVLETEPPSKGHLLLDGSIPNLIITPHTAWASRGARQRVVEEVASNISAFIGGVPRNVVDA